VLVEALVFDGDDGLDEVRRDLPDWDLDPLLLEDREGRIVGGVEDRRRLRHLPDRAKGVAVGQTRCEVVAEPRGPTTDEEHHDCQERDEGGQDSRPSCQPVVNPVRTEAGKTHLVLTSKMQAGRQRQLALSPCGLSPLKIRG
jgi:hypothetical protein